MLEDRQPQPTTDDLSAPAESEASVSGRRTKGRGFGLDYEAHVSSLTFTSALPPSNLAMEDHIDRLEMMMVDMMDMMLEMQVSSSTVAPPPTNPPADNQKEDEERLD
ncbi:UNVERIFIED_CONTAM: hypothetical protein Sindi_2281500 [Sesamum indicum]